MNKIAVAAIISTTLVLIHPLQAMASCSDNLPDLTVLDMTYTPIRDQAQVTVRVQNLGTAQPALTSQQIQLYRGHDLLDKQNIPSLVAGGTYAATFMVPGVHGFFTAIYVPEPDTAGSLDCNSNNNRLGRLLPPILPPSSGFFH